MESVLALPTEEALEALVALPEDQWFDRKSGRVQAKDLAAALVALANAEGGYLVVGIHGGVVEGVSPTRANEIRQAALDHTEPPVKMTVSEIASPAGKPVLVLRVEAGDAVHVTAKGGCFLRVGDETRRLNYAQQRELDYDLGSAFFDLQPVDAVLDDLDQSACVTYQRLLGAATVESAFHARDLLTKDGKVTVALWLLFAERPGLLFPSSHVRVLKYADRERGTGSRMTLMAGHDVRFDGPVGQQITQAIDLVAQWIPNLQRLADDGVFRDTPIIPTKAWEEGIINAVTHRSYSMQGDHTRIEIFPDRIEITNPGRFPGLANLRNPMSVVRFARNPRIARVLADMGIARELGEGIRRMFEHMRKAGLADPIYQQSSMGVRLTLLDEPVPAAVRANLSPTAQRVLSALYEARRPLGTTQVAEMADISRPTASRTLKKLEEQRLVTWAGNAPNDPRSTWSLA